MKRIVSIAAAALMAFSLATGVFAAGSPTSTVTADSVKTDVAVTTPTTVTVDETAAKTETTVAKVDTTNDQAVAAEVNKVADTITQEAQTKATTQAAEVAKQVTAAAATTSDTKTAAVNNTVFTATTTTTGGTTATVGEAAVTTALKSIYTENAAAAAKAAVTSGSTTADVVVAVTDVQVKIATPDVGLNGEDVNAAAVTKAKADADVIATQINNAIASGTIKVDNTANADTTVAIMGAFELCPVLSVTTSVSVNGATTGTATKNISIDNTGDGVKSAVSSAVGATVPVSIAVAAVAGKTYALMHYTDGSWQVVDGVLYDAATGSLTGNLDVAKYFSAFAVAEITRVAKQAAETVTPTKATVKETDQHPEIAAAIANGTWGQKDTAATTTSSTAGTTGTAAGTNGSSVRLSPKTGDSNG